MSKYKFPCGCEFDVVDEEIKGCDGLPAICIDYYNIPLDCPITWELIQSGKTKGIFQIETNLGKKWSKELSPTKIDELSALVSIMRPGVLKAIVDGKSMTQKYCDRKNAKEEIEYFHKALEPILKDTYSILIYQEQAMKIAQDIAGFTLEEADSLRKAIGKKLPELMAKIKTQFIEGCKKVGIVTEEDAAQIFGWIQESQRYSFNASHSLSYGTIGYWTAYAKAHFPLHFFTSWLYYADEKMDPQEEVQQLVSDARYFGIDVKPPSLTQLFNGNPGHFSFNGNKIYFGIGNIKKIGESHVERILTNAQELETILGRTIDKWSWYDFLVFFSDTISQSAVNGLIAAGATDYMGGNRSAKVHEYNSWRELTQKERDWIRENYPSGPNILFSINKVLEHRPKTSESRKAKIKDVIKNLQKPPYNPDDDAYFIASHEQELLGIPLTCSKLDTCNKNLSADTTCKEFLEGKSGKISIKVEIIGVSEYIIKSGASKGQKMLFLRVEDETGTLESVVVFPNKISGNESILINGSTVIIEGQRDKKRGDSLILENIIQI